jgi:hypothetical protein
MNLLYNIRNEISTPSKSPLEQWLKTHAKGNRDDDFEAYIDPNDEFKHSDKLSQVLIENYFINSNRNSLFYRLIH